MSAAPDHARPRLAVIDDNAQFRAIVRAVAEPLGWQVACYSGGRAFLDSLATAPDLVLLDMAMPEMDGIETIGHLRGRGLACPIVLVTGRMPIYATTAAELGRAYGLRILATLQKPVPVAELRAVLDPRRPACPG